LIEESRGPSAIGVAYVGTDYAKGAQFFPLEDPAWVRERGASEIQGRGLRRAPHRRVPLATADGG